MAKEIKMKQQTALNEYEKKQEEIQKILKQIAAGLEKHDRAASGLGGHNWGHVGDLTDIVTTLQDIKDRLHQTGEYAQAAK